MQLAGLHVCAAHKCTYNRLMAKKTITFRLDDDLVIRARAHAAAKGTTLNQMIRDLLQKRVDEWKREKALKEAEAAKECDPT